MQNQTVRAAFKRWLSSYITRAPSPASTTAARVYNEIIDPLFGGVLCSTIQLDHARVAIEQKAMQIGSAAAGHAFHLFAMMMEDIKLWPRPIIPYEAFTARSSLDTPLSPLEVADLVCKMPMAFRGIVHIILLTGIRPQQLVMISRSEFVRMLDRLDSRENRSVEIFDVHLAGAHSPVYLTLPIVNQLRSMLNRMEATQTRVFTCTAASINHAWQRYADDAPSLNRFKATAGTHLLRHGGDAHVLSANLGVNLSSAESIIERLSPIVNLEKRLATA